jgi:hypothetical protein
MSFSRILPNVTVLFRRNDSSSSCLIEHARAKVDLLVHIEIRLHQQDCPKFVD